MRWIKCQNCGKIVQTDGEKAFCPECRAELKAKYTLAERTCQECGKTFIGGPRAWYCPECRPKREKEAAKRYRDNGPQRKLGSLDCCEICGKEYVVKSGQQKYCKDCSEFAVKEIDRAQGREWNAKNRERLAEQKKEKQENRKVCVVCGKQFYAGSPSVTCSEACSKVWRSYNMAKTDLKRGKRVEEPDLLVMAVRAGIDVRERFEKPSAWVKDLVGRTFGELTVIGYTGESKRGVGAIWWCLCSCGKICKKGANRLTQGGAISCGHGRKRWKKDISGMKFGELTAIRPAGEKTKSGSVVWECKCSCGKTCFATKGQLTLGKKKSCGHLEKRDISKKRYGRLVALFPVKKRSSAGGLVWVCRCDCGGIKAIRENSLEAGRTRSCGCLSKRGGKECAKCPACGTRFEIEINGNPTPQFCPKCSEEYKEKKMAICPVCGTMFEYSEDYMGIACSEECFKKWSEKNELDQSNA